MNAEANYATYKKYLRAYIKRDGIDGLIDYLDHSDAVICPASTKYHLSCEGGYVLHSLNVFSRLIALLKDEYGDNIPYSKETIAIVALLHDISKVNYYKKTFRNVKDENGKWTSVEQYSVRDDNERLVFGTHEENSLHILQNFFKLSYDEQISILYHMGSNTDSPDEYHSARMLTAYKAVPLALFLHTADMLATCIDEVEKKEEKKEEKQNEQSSQPTNTEVEVQVPFSC